MLYRFSDYKFNYTNEDFYLFVSLYIFFRVMQPCVLMRHGRKYLR